MKGQKRYLDRFTCGSFILFFFLIIFLGCATKDAVRSLSDEDVLRQRVTEYWDHVMKDELESSYTYEDPFYRKTVNTVNYVRSFNPSILKWQHADIQGISIKENVADIDLKVLLHITIQGVPEIKQNVAIKDRWLKVDGIWYHQPPKGSFRRNITKEST